MSEPLIKPRRNANIELLRILSIMMVTTLHALGKSEALAGNVDFTNGTYVIAWIFESLSISAVNIFMLISGYFLIKSSFKVSRLAELVCQTLFYTVLAFAIGIATGLLSASDVNTYYILNVALPIHMNIYWFITVYIFIYILSPIISAGVNSISKKQFETVLIILLVYECLFKSILPFTLTTDEKGYNLIWCLTVFLTGAYMRLYGIKFLNSFSRGISVYFVSIVLLFSECMVLKTVYVITGRLAGLTEVSYNYNHLFVFTSAVGIFTAFLNKKEITGNIEKIILFLSPMTLGVYLFHENITFRYEWTRILGINASVSESPVSFLIHLVLGVLCIFVIGSAVDFIRIKLFALVKKLFASKS